MKPLIVLVDKSYSSDPHEVIVYVYNDLHNMLHKQYGNNYHSKYYIGGQWSGFLSTLYLNINKLNKFQKKGGELDLWDWYKKDKLEELFMKFFPDYNGLFPYFRNESGLCGLYGCVDDIMIVDDIIYDKVIFKGIVELIKNESSKNPTIFLMSNNNNLSKQNSINKQWAVVVDITYV